MARRSWPLPSLASLPVVVVSVLMPKIAKSWTKVSSRHILHWTDLWSSRLAHRYSTGQISVSFNLQKALQFNTSEMFETSWAVLPNEFCHHWYFRELTQQRHWRSFSLHQQSSQVWPEMWTFPSLPLFTQLALLDSASLGNREFDHLACASFGK